MSDHGMDNENFTIGKDRNVFRMPKDLQKFE